MASKELERLNAFPIDSWLWIVLQVLAWITFARLYLFSQELIGKPDYKQKGGRRSNALHGFSGGLISAYFNLSLFEGESGSGSR